MRKLIYLNMTRPNISYVVKVVSQFMHNPQIDHWNVVIRIPRYIKKNAPRQGLLYEYKEILKLYVMHIGLIVTLTRDPPQDIGGNIVS